MKDKNLYTDLTARDCTCRKCGALYIGHGALCEAHATELAKQTATENARSEAFAAAHDRARRAERRAQRSEWSEAV